MFRNPEDNTPLDLTTYERVTMQIRRNPDADATIITVNNTPAAPTDSRIELSDGVSDTNFELTILASDTAAFPAGEHFYDIEFVESGGKVKTFLWGIVEVYKDVTRVAP